jgi:hypothetical protein
MRSMAMNFHPLSASSLCVIACNPKRIDTKQVDTSQSHIISLDHELTNGKPGNGKPKHATSWGGGDAVIVYMVLL